MVARNDEIYIQLKDSFTVNQGSSVLVGDLITMITSSNVKKELLDIEVLSTVGREKEHAVVSILAVIEKIKAYDPYIKIYPVGTSEILLTILPKEKEVNRISTILKLVLVASILFTGTGLAIMNFHADVNMAEAHRQLYQLITGIDQKRPLALQIPYSFGIGLGMALFFNQVFQRKTKNEPSPMEVEMYLYKKNIDQYILDNEKETENIKKE